MLLIGLFTLALMLLPAPASAEPVSLTILAALSIQATATAVAVTTTILTTVVSLALSYVASALLKPAAKSGGGPMGSPDTALGSKQSVRQPTAPMQVVYGRTKVGGVYADLWVANGNQNLYGAMILGGHEFESIDEIWLGDQLSETDATTGVIKTGRFAGNGSILKYLGAAGQLADETLVSTGGTRWTSDHRLRGLPYLRLSLYWDNSTGTGNPYFGTWQISYLGAKLWAGGLPNITAVVKGKKIYDPRTGLTAWSNNSALVVADYLCDPVFGLGVDYATGIDETALIAAANICDENVTLDGGGTEKRYTTDGFFKVDGTPDAILGRLLGAMHGSAIYDGERWVIKAGAWEEPDAVVLTDDDMRAASSLQTLTSTRDICNAVKGTYVGEETEWQPADFPSIQSNTFKTADGGVEKWRDIELPYSSTSTRCQRLAKIDLLKQRYEIVETFKGKLKCWRYTAGQTVYRTSERYGWTNKAFMVGAVRVVPAEDDAGNPMLGVDLTLYETAASIYSWSTSEETPISTPANPAMPDLYNVVEPTEFSAAESVYTTVNGLGIKSKVTLTWLASADQLVVLGGHYETQWRVTGQVAWNALPNTMETTIEILDVKPASYQYRLRAVNYADNPSDWVTTSLTVSGDSTPPEDVVGFTSLSGVSGFTTFSWTAPVNERARAGTVEMRYSTATSGATWASATAIVVQSALNTQAIIQTKIGTYLIKHKSQNGVYSTNAVSATITTTAQPKVGVEIVSTLPTTDLYEGRIVYLSTDDKLYRYTGSAWTTAVAAVDLSGTLAAANFPSDLRPVELVTSLPSTGNFEGRVVYLTTDDKLYRYTGSAWTAAVPAADISGTLADAQIAALAASKITGQLSDAQLAAISAAKLTGQITSTQITDGAISTPKLAAGSITTAKIAAGAVTAGEISASAITAAKISAGAVETAAIAAGAIQAGNIAAGAVTAGKIAANAVTTTEIAASAVTADKVQAGAISAAAIAASAISSDKIAANAVTTAKLAAGAVTATEIATNAITADKITAGAVTAAKISVSQLSAMSADMGSITAGTITGATFRTASSGARSIMDGTRTMIRTVDPLYNTRAYYRSLSGVTEQDIVANMGADDVAGVPTGYIRAIGYGGGHGIDGIALGNTSTPNSTPNAQGVTGLGDFAGMVGTSGYIGVIGNGGTWDFYADGSGSNYGPFTGTHDALIDKAHDVEVGDIVIDVALVAQKSISNAITRVERSSAANQPGALGVVSGRDALHVNGPPAALAAPRADGVTYDTIAEEYADLIDTHDRLRVNAIGEGLINVVGQGGDIAIGDLIVTSDTAGKGMKQADNIMRGHTVAKAREAVTFTTAGEVRTIACIYVSG